MKRTLICIFLLLFILCSCQNDETVTKVEPTVQQFNEMFDRQLSSYYYHCDKTGLDAFCDDVFENTDKPIEYVYRAIQYAMFDIVEENGFAKGGIHNHDVYLYKDGTAEFVYRHGVEEGKEYFIDKNMRFEMSEAEISSFKEILTENDFEHIPTWNPKEPEVLDGKTIYIFGTNKFTCHLATSHNVLEDDAIRKIRSSMEQILSAHIE